MKPHHFFIIFLLVVLAIAGRNYQDTDPSVSTSVYEINGRNREPIYRIRVPNEWIWKTPLPKDSLADTTKALFEVIINDTEGIIRITIHNFPSESLEDRISPLSQVARWEHQFDSLEPNNSYTIPQAFSGYTGLLFHGTGILHEKRSVVLGWALQIAPEHYRTLLRMNEGNALTYKQMRGDVTIKAVGPYSLIEKYETAIIAMARSFELIEEIPQRL